MNLTIKPLTPELLTVYLEFFDNMAFTEHPHWSICYCYSYHFTGSGEQWTKVNNRAGAIRCIKERKMHGYMAFDNEKPVGWCNVNNRGNYERLMKYYDLVYNPADKACSIVCFLVSPDYRRKGIAQKLLERVCQDAGMQDYDYVEAYPDKGELSCEGLYTGPLKMYQKSGFNIIKEHDNYYVVRKILTGKTGTQ